MHDLSGTVILIPCYEPDEKLFELLQRLSEKKFMKIVLVNDGSKKECDELFCRCKDIFDCTVIGYDKNQGKGFALKKGFTYICENIKGFECIVTADSDGQHTPEDICRVAEEAIMNKNSVILGSRNCLDKNVPLRSRFGNRLTRTVFRILCGVSVNDTQTGLRGFSKEIIGNFIDIPGNRYEYEMRVLMTAGQKKIPIKEIEIQTVYLNENASSHFNPLKDSIRIYSVFGAHIAKFLFSSLFATFIDWILFTCLIYFVFRMQVPETASFTQILSSIPLLVSFICARAISSLINFIINKNVVFKNKKNIFFSALKYYFLVILIAVSSYLLLSLFVTIGIPTAVAQPMATVILFAASYYFQRAFVF